MKKPQQRNRNNKTPHPNPLSRQVGTLPFTAPKTRLKEDLPKGAREKILQTIYFHKKTNIKSFLPNFFPKKLEKKKHLKFSRSI